MELPARAALSWAEAKLKAAGTTSPSAEARTLLAHAAQTDETRMALLDALDDTARNQFAALVERRAAGVPVQHLTGKAYFRHATVAVGPGVFVPRPETEPMTGWVIDLLRGRAPGARVVELCAGSGAISRSIADEAPGHEQWAVELSPDAIGYLSTNLAGTGVRVIEGDMVDCLPELDGTVDVVVCNPPYIPLDAYESVAAEVRDHDPTLALFSGADGLDAMRVLADVAARLLRPGGAVTAEHAEAQAVVAPRVFVRHGAFTAVRDYRDLGGRPRYLTATRTDGRMGA